MREQGFAIKGISSDTFQSYDTGQQLKAENFNYDIVSVDRVNTDHICLPYQYFKSTIYEERIEMYENRLLTEELIGLERDNNSGKVDHSPSGINSKDSADAVCGALWNASQHAEEYNFQYGETLDAVHDANAVDEYNMKEQIIIDFEEELKKSANLLNMTIPNQQDNGWLDFGFGKAVPVADYYMNDGIIVI